MVWLVDKEMKQRSNSSRIVVVDVVYHKMWQLKGKLGHKDRLLRRSFRSIQDSCASINKNIVSLARKVILIGKEGKTYGTILVIATFRLEGVCAAN